MDGIYKYRLLAFVVASKLRRRNSCLYKHEKSYTVAKELGISANTFAKYKKDCIQKGYLIQRGSGYYFKNLAEIVYDIFGAGQKLEWKHIRFFRGICYERINYKAILARIEFAVAECNYKRQDYKIKGLTKAVSLLQNRFITHKEGRMLKRLAKRHGCEISDLPSICKNNYIKSGKEHVANLLDCSKTTGANRLKKWAKFAFLRRTVIKEVINIAACAASYDYLKESGLQNFAPYCNGYITTIGSKIELMSK